MRFAEAAVLFPGSSTQAAPNLGHVCAPHQLSGKRFFQSRCKHHCVRVGRRRIGLGRAIDRLASGDRLSGQYARSGTFRRREAPYLFAVFAPLRIAPRNRRGARTDPIEQHDRNRLIAGRHAARCMQIHNLPDMCRELMRASRVKLADGSLPCRVVDNALIHSHTLSKMCGIHANRMPGCTRALMRSAVHSSVALRKPCKAC